MALFTMVALWLLFGGLVMLYILPVQPSQKTIGGIFMVCVAVLVWFCVAP